MKSKVLRLIKVGILTAALLAFCPGMPAVDQVFTPPAVHQSKPISAPAGVKHLAKVEDLVFAMTNRFRQDKGLAPLAKDEELRHAARAFSDDMLVRRFFDHTTPEGLSFDERLADRYPHRFYVVGENIWRAFGYNPDRARQVAQEIVDSWMTSPGHRANLLSPDYTHLGVGVSARHNSIRATQEFVGKFEGFSFEKLISIIKTRVQSSGFEVQS